MRWWLLADAYDPPPFLKCKLCLSFYSAKVRIPQQLSLPYIRRSFTQSGREIDSALKRSFWPYLLSSGCCVLSLSLPVLYTTFNVFIILSFEIQWVRLFLLINSEAFIYLALFLLRKQSLTNEMKNKNLSTKSSFRIFLNSNIIV